MKIKFSYAASALISFVLCAVMLCGAVIPASANGTELPSLNYENNAIDNPVTLSAHELYAILLEQTSSGSESRKPTEGEKLYLEATGIEFTYTDFIPDSCINTQYDGDRGVLYVTLTPYTYRAANGADVTWVPKQLIFKDQSYKLLQSDGIYSTTITNCYETGDFHMQVEYVWQVEIPTEIISILREEAYEKGYAAHLVMETYRKELAEYEALVDIKNKWDAYNQWEEDYANYVIQKAIYDELKVKYDAYMVEYNAYQAIVDAYNQWQDYFAQEEAYKTNQQPYAEYAEYYKQYKTAVDKMAMFESIFVTEPRGWCMYADIMGGSVTEVLGKQDLLIAGGCNAADIHLGGQSTENLRVLLKGYNDIRVADWSSEHEKNKALYKYYSDHYEELKKNFCDLYRVLKGLYENSAVSNYIGLKGKTLHYRQLVGHLFVISTALDTGSTRNEDTWRIDRKKLMDVIDPVHYFPDGDWDPRNTVFPENEVPYVERVEEPVKPTVQNPGAMPLNPPEKVENPGEEPAFVADPSGTPRPEAPKPIGNKPKEPALDAAVVQLYKDIESGKLKPYGQTVSAETVTLTKLVDREVSIKNIKIVTLYHPDGRVYKQIPVESGKGIDRLEPYPLANSEGYEYHFLRWAHLLPNGDYADADVSCITENISLYPVYRATPKVFTITWIIDGISHVTQCYFGRTPNPSSYIGKYPYQDDYYVYTFSGWDREIEPVKGDTTYIGSTQKAPRKFQVTWVIENGAKSITQEWEYKQTPTFDVADFYITSTSKFTFWTWDKRIAPVTRDVTYTAKYKEIPLASASANAVYEIISNDTEMIVLATKSTVKMEEAARLADELGKKLTVYWEGILSVSLEGEELKAYINSGCLPLLLSTRQEEEITYYDFEYFSLINNPKNLPHATVCFENIRANGGEILYELKTANGWESQVDNTFVADGKFSARSRQVYYVIPQANAFCNVAQIPNKVSQGEWVDLNLNCVYGYKIVGVKVTDANGEQIALSGLSFQMPATTVSVELQVEKIVYTVTFMVDGNIWHSAQYYAGDEIVLPAEPSKEAKDDYSYTFTGWGNVPALASGENENLVFEAVWVKSLIVNDYESGHNNNVLFGVIMPCIIVIAGLVVVFFILRKKALKMGGWRILWTGVIVSLKRWFHMLRTNQLFKNINKTTQSKK